MAFFHCFRVAKRHTIKPAKTPKIMLILLEDFSGGCGGIECEDFSGGGGAGLKKDFDSY
jgi:hypothetical protein